MDSLITAAARALAAGDAFGALNRVALRDDAPALALRGIAMAQLGDLERAKLLLKRAARAFGSKAPMAHARCIVAEAEIALVSRDLTWPPQTLEKAQATLVEHGDWVNAAQARYLEIRRLLLIGKLDAAERRLAVLNPSPLPPALRIAHELAVAGVAIRRVKAQIARSALNRAGQAARLADIPALTAEVEAAQLLLDTPAARLIAAGAERPMLLDEVEAMLASDALIIDASRNVVRSGTTVVSLATRPVLFSLARTLAETWPDDAPRAALLARAFRAKHADESHRARLRVEIGRLRAALAPLASITATRNGFLLEPHAGAVAVLAPPVEEENAAVLAFLADGESWSSSALAIALGNSPRTIQRALEQLAAAGSVQSFGRGRARRWTIPTVPGFPTSLLLPGPLPSS